MPHISYQDVIATLELLVILLIFITEVYYGERTLREQREVKGHFEGVAGMRAKYYATKMKKLSAQAQEIAAEAERDAHESSPV